MPGCWCSKLIENRKLIDVVEDDSDAEASDQDDNEQDDKEGKISDAPFKDYYINKEQDASLILVELLRIFRSTRQHTRHIALTLFPPSRKCPLITPIILHDLVFCLSRIEITCQRFERNFDTPDLVRFRNTFRHGK